MRATQKIRYSDAELHEFEALIHRKIQETEESLEQLMDSLQSSNDQTMGSSSYDINDYVDYAEKEYLINMIRRQEKHLYNLNRAIIRISNKTYGICQKTGDLIDKKRLLIVPHTTHSLEAKAIR